VRATGEGPRATRVVDPVRALGAIAVEADAQAIAVGASDAIVEPAGPRIDEAVAGVRRTCITHGRISG
jgi:hypothetical protein